MSDDSTPPSATSEAVARRKVLVGGAVGVGAAVLAGGAVAMRTMGGGSGGKAGILRGPTTDQLVAKRVSDALPVDDPTSSVWGQAEGALIELDSQIMAQPHRTTPILPSLSVRALHDGSTIAFRLDWEDDKSDDAAIKVDQFRDACAVLLHPEVGNGAARVMGTATAPATLLHWKADWQWDVDNGYRDVYEQFPNTSVDFYPPLAPYEGPPEIPTTYDEHNATQWLPGYAVGNPISQPVKTSAVEKAIAHSFGSLATAATQDAKGRGVWSEGVWSVVLAKPLAAADEGETALTPGSEAACAFAVWAGQQQDVGSRKSPCKFIVTLRVEA